MRSSTFIFKSSSSELIKSAKLLSYSISATLSDEKRPLCYASEDNALSFDRCLSFLFPSYLDIPIVYGVLKSTVFLDFIVLPLLLCCYLTNGL